MWSDWSYRVSSMRGGRSRNKVAVGEPAAGSPPNFLNKKKKRNVLIEGS